MRINHGSANVDMAILRYGARHQDRITRAIARLSSGRALARAADNAAYASIEHTQVAQIRGKQQAERNCQDAIGLARTAQDGLSHIQEIVGRMQTLVLQGANGTLSDTDRHAVTTELRAMARGIDDVTQSARFNGYSPLQGVTGVASGNSYIFLLDNSGSTGGAITGFLKQIERFARTALNSDPDAQFGVSLLNESIDSADGVTKVLDLTNDVTQLSEGSLKASVVAATGTGTNRAGSVDLYAGIINSLPGGSDGFAINPLAQNQMIILTDTDREVDKLGPPTFDETQAQILASLQAYDLKVSAIGTPGKTDLLGNNKGIGAIINGTSGQFSPIGGDLAASLNRLILPSSLRMQVGPGAADEMAIECVDVRAEALGIDGLDLDDVTGALAAINTAQARLNEEQIKWGSYGRRLQTKVNRLTHDALQESSAVSEIADVDVAAEWVRLTQAQIGRNISIENLATASRLRTSAFRMLLNT